MSPIQLHLQGTIIRAEIVKARNVPSKHTGQPLRVLNVEFYTGSESELDRVTSLSSDRKPFQVKQDSGEPLGKFKAGRTSYSYQDQRSDAKHLWELEEIEELNVQNLVLADLAVVPYRYEEEFDDRGLHIKANVRLTGEEEERLRVLPHYFQVIRRGISDEPIEMRFGQLVWSRQEGDDFKMQLILVDRAYDEPRPLPRPFDPELNNVERMLVETNESLRALLFMLEDKGVLAKSEVEKLTQPSDESLKNRYKELFRVRDLDEWQD